MGVTQLGALEEADPFSNSYALSASKGNFAFQDEHAAFAGAVAYLLLRDSLFTVCWCCSGALLAVVQQSWSEPLHKVGDGQLNKLAPLGIPS